MEREELRVISRQLTPNDVVAELLALSVVEHSYTPGIAIDLEIGSTVSSISDTGRGLRMHPDAGDTMPHAERALTGFYPCLPDDPETRAVLHELIWRDHGALGPALANLACPSLTFTSRRGNESWSQSFRFGVPLSAPSMLGVTTKTGTTIQFETAGQINDAVLAELIGNLMQRIPNLTINKRAF